MEKLRKVQEDTNRKLTSLIEAAGDTTVKEEEEDQDEDDEEEEEEEGEPAEKVPKLNDH